MGDKKVPPPDAAARMRKIVIDLAPIVGFQANETPSPAYLVDRRPSPEALDSTNSPEKDIGAQIDRLLSASSVAHYLHTHLALVKERQSKNLHGSEAITQDEMTFPLGGVENSELVEFHISNVEKPLSADKEFVSCRYRVGVSLKAYRALFDLVFKLEFSNLIFDNLNLLNFLSHRENFSKALRVEYGFRYTKLGRRFVDGLGQKKADLFYDNKSKILARKKPNQKEKNFRIIRCFLLWLVFDRELIYDESIKPRVHYDVLEPLLGEVHDMTTETFSKLLHTFRLLLSKESKKFYSHPNV